MSTINFLDVLILCEGYHDRAFLKGWLHHLGWESRTVKNRTDGWGKVEGGGVYGFKKGGRAVRLLPCKGKDVLRTAAQDAIQGTTTRGLGHLMVIPDGDVVDTSPDLEFSQARQGVHDRVTTWLEPPATSGITLEATSELLKWTTNTRTNISACFWATATVAHTLPQNLERLIYDVYARAYPHRLGSVRTWLEQRPERPERENPKSYTWAIMAGWAADHGCEAFFEQLWQDKKIVGELQPLLNEAGLPQEV